MELMTKEKYIASSRYGGTNDFEVRKKVDQRKIGIYNIYYINII